MRFYPAVVLAVDARCAVVAFEETGHQIAFLHSEYNAVPTGMRQPGVKGFVSFPKAPPFFTAAAA